MEASWEQSCRLCRLLILASVSTVCFSVSFVDDYYWNCMPSYTRSLSIVMVTFSVHSWLMFTEYYPDHLL